MRVEDVDEDDENRFEQTRQDLIYTNSSVFGFLSFATILLWIHGRSLKRNCSKSSDVSGDVDHSQSLES